MKIEIEKNRKLENLLIIKYKKSGEDIIDISVNLEDNDCLEYEFYLDINNPLIRDTNEFLNILEKYNIIENKILGYKQN